MVFIRIAVVLLALVVLSNAITVRQAVSQSCETSIVGALSRQIVDVLNQISPGAFTDLTSPEFAGLFTLSGSVQPYLQTAAANALARVARARGTRMSINSALRSLPQQVLLYSWYRNGRCGIRLAAKPGNSNHQSGAAVDVDDHAGWNRYFSANGWKWFGAADIVHFDFLAGDARFKANAIRAFQMLWNANNPGSRLPEDGVYSTQVENAVLNSPASGFANTQVGGGGGGGVAAPAAGGTACTDTQGNSGTCIDQAQCTGTTVHGLCPGAANILCCIPPAAPAAAAPAAPAPPAPPAPAGGGTACTDTQGNSGTCMDQAQCTGTTVAGLCPGAANILCCIPPAAPAAPAVAPVATPDVGAALPAAPAPADPAPAAPATACTDTQGNAGTCIDQAQCTGTTVAGLCPGAANIQCCIPPAASPADPAAPATACTDTQGNAGTCIDQAQCAGTTVAGLCPGAANIQCCIPPAGTPLVRAAQVNPSPADGTVDWLSVLRKIAPQGKADVLQGVAASLPAVFAKYNINTKLRQAHFLGQCAVESARFTTTVEFGTGREYEGRRDLGNTQKGDGPRYKGRGIIQLTGRANYRRVGGILGVDLESNPDQAAQFPIAVLTAGQFWQDRNINSIADRDNVAAVTRAVNGGSNALALRKQFTTAAKSALANAQVRAATTTGSSSALPDWAVGLLTGVGSFIVTALIIAIIAKIVFSKYSKDKRLVRDSGAPLLSTSLRQLTPLMNRKVAD